MSAADHEPGFLTVLLGALGRWLAVARALVFSAGRDNPDPSAIMATTAAWIEEVDSVIMPALETVAGHGWRWQSGEPFVSRNSFVLAQLALTRNLLVRLPEEVYHRVFLDLVEGRQAGESPESIAARIDATLLLSGSEWWQNRAKVIVQTETNRAWNAGVLASAQYYEPATGTGWVKVWDTDMDGAERASHRRANGQVRALHDMFQVGGQDLAFPGDPRGRPENVINCRCTMTIRKAG